MAKKGEEEITIATDLVVVAVGFQPNRELAEGLEGKGIEFYIIGDAREPRGAGEAIREGFQVAIGL